VDVQRIQQNDRAYPTVLLNRLAEAAPPVIHLIGDSGILHNHLMGLLCSVQCPGSIILHAFDAIRALRDSGVVVVGGFHSPMERECLLILLRGSQPIIICPARDISNMRVPSEWQSAIHQDRLLLLSAFNEKEKRVTSALAERRNRFVAAIANKVFVPYASPKSKTEKLCREVIGWGKPLLTIESAENRNMFQLGAHAL
jgi:predicted Rossmann fold nucleotide-binding protein DprA/Smf involved in DNA uptake